MHSLILDLKFAIRILLRHPTMTFVVRIQGDPAAATTDVRTAIGRTGPMVTLRYE